MAVCMPENKPFDPIQAIYTPPEVAFYGKQAIENMRQAQARGLPINIPTLKDYFAPLLPGQVCAIIAQTSHYKSGFMHFIEHQAAMQLQAEKRTDEILVHISVEEGV